METIYLNQDSLAYWQGKAKRSVAALGFFDGIHKGHQEVIRTASQIAKRKNLSLSVMSFFPHPKEVISNGKKQVNYLMPLSEKEERLRALGVDTFYIVEFTKEFASLLPAQFVAQYLLDLGIVHAVAGFDFSYGYKGTGHMGRLQKDSFGLIDVTKVKKLEFHGVKISSTLIRENLMKGYVEELPSLLGRPYEVESVWDGNALEMLPYYTLPAPGCYEVILKNKTESIQTKMIVSETVDGLSLTCLSEISNLMTGRLSIVWLQRMIGENHLSLSEKISLSSL
ncbi:FAD synthetase family protein [Niallia endozanthoxylica]|uniref:FAD synthase n=1 Tax=Niallia endozanthoxylica TaxID=2036016 RepID=A0A5J5I0G5_9BACI|nr:FAD synthetase family protein [Niallia endozanthoxylica]KAA9028618.1 FAD synthetase family protein [Niallia endozanthoxylica]